MAVAGPLSRTPTPQWGLQSPPRRPVLVPRLAEPSPNRCAPQALVSGSGAVPVHGYPTQLFRCPGPPRTQGPRTTPPRVAPAQAAAADPSGDRTQGPRTTPPRVAPAQVPAADPAPETHVLPSGDRCGGILRSRGPRTASTPRAVSAVDPAPESQLLPTGVPLATQGAMPGLCDVDPWLTVEAQQQRRVNLQLTDPVVESWIEECEFISLGNYCGVARSLQCLGVKKFSYPFDWVRSPVSGIIHCLENEFCDFLTWSVCRDDGPRRKVYGSSAWGGSFWHHDPAAPATCEEFTRRVERFYGLQEVPAERARLFVWAVNSTRELEDSIRLRDVLECALPEADIYLLILIDMQEAQGPLRLSSDQCCNILFYRISEALFMDRGRQWSMQKQGEAYAEAIAFAVRVWAGKSAWSSVSEVMDVDALRETLEPFDGGSCANQLFDPRRFECQKLKVQRPIRLQSKASSRVVLHCEDPPKEISSNGCEHRPPPVPHSSDGSATPREETVSVAASDPDKRAMPRPGPEMLPTRPVETELQWRPPVSRTGSRAASPAPLAPPRDAFGWANELLPSGVITSPVAPLAVEHELMWTPRRACCSRAHSPAVQQSSTPRTYAFATPRDACSPSALMPSPSRRTYAFA